MTCNALNKNMVDGKFVIYEHFTQIMSQYSKSSHVYNNNKSLHLKPINHFVR